MFDWLSQEPKTQGWSSLPRWKIILTIAAYFFVPWLFLSVLSGGTFEHFKIGALVVGVPWAVLMLWDMPKGRQ